jgi:hypothetical protein
MLVFEAADLIDYINDAQIDICRKTDMLQGALTQNVQAGVEIYTLPVDFIEVQRVTYNGTKLYKTTWQEIDMLDPGKDQLTTEGVPDHYYRRGNTLYLYPIPATSVTNALKVYYSRTPVVLANDTDTPELPIAMHEDICIRVIARGHEQVEDFQASQVKANEYNSAIAMSIEQAQEGSDESYPMIRDIEGQVY